MFTFEDRDEGYMAYTAQGRGVAFVETRKLTETNDPNLRVQKKVAEELPRDRWLLRYTAAPLTRADNAALLAQVAELK